MWQPDDLLIAMDRFSRPEISEAVEEADENRREWRGCVSSIVIVGVLFIVFLFALNEWMP